MKTRLAVIFGSRTCEHDVSIISGLQAAGAADPNKYDVTLVYISRSGEWYVGDKLREIGFYPQFDPRLVVRVKPSGEGGKLVLTEAEKRALFGGKRVAAECDLVLPVMHGLNGEDGTLQGMLELWNIPYASSGVLGSAVGMDKIAMKLLFRGCGFPVLPDAWLDRAAWKRDRDGEIRRIEAALPYPMFVKPANLGSSIGINRADDRASLIAAIEVAVSFDRRVLVERGVTKLKEVNCAVLGYGADVRTSATEMPVRWDDAALLDFKDKYLRGGKGKGMSSLERRIPAPIGEDMNRRVKALSLEIFRALDCKGVARVDFLIDEETGELYVGEINTIPGSLAFYLWEAEGIRFRMLIDRMVECALRAHEDKNASTYAYESAILTSGGFGAKGKR